MLSTLEQSADNVVNIVNYNWDCIVLVWYKIVEINDQNNIYNFDATESIEAGNIGYHGVHMYPTNCNADEYQFSKYNNYLLN